MTNKGSLTLIAVLFAVIIFGSTVFLSASSERSDSYEIYNRGAVLESIEPQHLNDPVSWMKDLDKIITPEERNRIAEADPQELNTTERFIQELVNEVLEKQSLTESEHEKYFVEFLKKETQTIMSQNELFQKDSFNIQKNPNKNDVIAYGNTVGEIIKRNSPDLDHELIIFRDLVEKGGRQQKKDLRTIAQGYKNIAEEASKILVPEDAVTVHLNFINTMKTVGFFVEKLSFFQEDPLSAMIVHNRDMKNEDLYYKTMKDIFDYFTQRDVIYQLTDDGIYYNPIKRQN